MTHVSSLVWFVALSRAALDSVIGNAGRKFRSPAQYENLGVTYVANKILVSHMWPTVMTTFALGVVGRNWPWPHCCRKTVSIGGQGDLIAQDRDDSR
jgi:hypothetical protein